MTNIVLVGIMDWCLFLYALQPVSRKPQRNETGCYLVLVCSCSLVSTVAPPPVSGKNNSLDPSSSLSSLLQISIHNVVALEDKKGFLPNPIELHVVLRGDWWVAVVEVW